MEFLKGVIFIAQCVSPLKAVRKKDGLVHILDRSAFDRYEKCGRLRDVHYAQEQGWIKSRYGDAFVFDVPCGRCINCRLNYARKWSQRCLLESKSWTDNWFLTLTYDDDHLPFSIHPDSGEVIGNTLEPADVRDFFKVLREYYRDTYNHIGIRFFMAGEYGDSTARPHYHVIMFNLPLDDLVVYSRSPLGDVYYTSALINSKWKKGQVIIGEVSAESVAYTARYCQKKATKNIDYDFIGIHREYVNMSRRPGIALPYLKEHIGEIYQDDLIYLPNGQTAHPMRYFDDKAAEMGVDIDEVKNRRLLISTLMNNQRVDEVSRDYYNQLEDLEKEFLSRSKALKRNLC